MKNNINNLICLFILTVSCGDNFISPQYSNQQILGTWISCLVGPTSDTTQFRDVIVFNANGRFEAKEQYYTRRDSTQPWTFKNDDFILQSNFNLDSDFIFIDSLFPDSPWHKYETINDTLFLHLFAWVVDSVVTIDTSICSECIGDSCYPIPCIISQSQIIIDPGTDSSKTYNYRIRNNKTYFWPEIASKYLRISS